MPEYRRFISYFYEYIDGKKQRNTGFAKVELRNGVWRILFRLTVPVQPEKPVEVFGFLREGEKLRGLPMGTMRAGKEMTEEWAYRADAPVWKGRYGLSDISGIWIRSGEGRCFVTVWDDEPVDPAWFTEDVKELPDQNRAEAQGKESPGRSQAEAQGKESPDRSQAEAQGKKVPDRNRPEEPGKKVPEQNRMKKREEELPKQGWMKEQGKGTSDQSRVTEPGREAPEQKRTEGQAAEGSEGKDVPAEENAQQKPEPDTVRREEESPKRSGEEEPVIADQELCAAGAEDAENRQDSVRMEAAAGEAFVPGGESGQSPEDDRLWSDLYRGRTPFQPFSDQEISGCIRVVPADIVRLQNAHWRTGRNNFLLHGYYNYRHLLIGRTADGGYVLGVPGIMNPQEKYMASMFGFPDFRYADGRDGDASFGYWCRPLERGGQ